MPSAPRLALAAAAALTALTAVSGHAAEKADPAHGRALAEARCASCHAVGEEGASPLPEAPPFRTFKEKWPLESLAESLAEGIVTGHSEMPEFVFKPDEIRDFLAYLGTL
jgi:mono/diheme cytochrome c family protein